MGDRQPSLGLYSCIFHRHTLQVMECSDTLAQALGMARGVDMVGRFVLDVFQPDSFEIFGRFVQGGNFEEGILCNLATPSGPGTRVVAGIASPAIPGDQLLTLFCLVVEDQQPRITALETQLEILSQQNVRLRDFTSIVVHDLANAIQTVTSGVSVLQMQLDGALTPDSRHKFERVEQASLAMNGIVLGVMKYLRFEVGEYPMEFTSLNALVDTMIAGIVEPAGKTLAIRRSSELPAMVCERQLIEELFRNLLGNAIKYCDKVLVQIEIGLEPARGPDPVFFLRDNGVGIHATDLSRVFEPFTRADRQGLNSSGSGMGMMLVQSIVERHGGEIWLESVVGEGTTVRFSLNSRPQPRA
jgi:light-regulated signal transduction histidine kinase (bacteriophytochrome)